MKQPMKTPRHRLYTHDEMHQWILNDPGMVTDPDCKPEKQAIFCPYFVRFQGVLGADWGVILNPDSCGFGLVTFEHDWCGCPEGAHDTGRQVTDEWRDRKRERAIAQEEARRSHQVQGQVGGVSPGSPRLDRDEGG